jgi:hypothetical protein
VNDDPTPVEGGPPEPAKPTEGWGPGWADLVTYLEQNAGSFTDEALQAAAIGAGWDSAIVDRALAKVHARQAAAPLRARAKRIVGILYLAGWALLFAGMAFNSVNQVAGIGGFFPLAVGILTVSLLITWVIGRSWASRIRVSQAVTPVDLAVALSVPVILWLAVAGICVATGLPIPRAA